MIKMVWDAPTPEDDAAPDAVLLKPEHASQAVELARLTNPGPFGIRTPELGEYFGYFDGGRLIAMAGERMCAGDFTRSAASAPTRISRAADSRRSSRSSWCGASCCAARRPFLHVMGHNTAARALYEKMGFRNYRETVVRVVARI